MAEDGFFKIGMLKEEGNKTESTLSMITSSEVTKTEVKISVTVTCPPKRSGPGRPRKIRSPPLDSDEDHPSTNRFLN
ncbi:unnamed protein product [Pieris macdunnoughi]|uniref:Uncharacterized protein n=1 Tax=Pieris macdunnoughi TaxID=345717 RepID=A0A821RE56_9NEOP|nr:unnamed protein product [Pieris macdunnoughi]